MKISFLIFICFFSLAPRSFALVVETFNLGLARGFVDHAEKRKPRLFESLKSGEADILCLQEVWTPEDRAEVQKKLLEVYPYSHAPPVHQTSTSKRPSCLPWELFGEGKFVSCMRSQCGESKKDEFAGCIINKCGESLKRLKEDNRECASSLMAKVGQSPIISILKLINPFYKSGLYAYGGSNGLVLLSKLPLKNRGLIDFSDISTLNRRQAITATIDHKGEKVKVVCAHLAAKLSAPYTGERESWAKENLSQVNRLISETRDDSMAIVMGDFNCGLKNSHAQEELPKSCETLSKVFDDPGALLDQCTYCSSNLLNSSGDNSYIDHIFLRGLKGKEPELSRKKVITIKVKGEELPTNLSDHFGLRATVD